MKIIQNTSISQKYFIFLFLVSAVSLLFSILFVYKFNTHLNIVDANHNMNFQHITYGNGPLISNLIENGDYSSKFLFYDFDFVLQKLPVLPLTIFSISKFTDNFYLIVIIKNLITFSVIFWAIIFYLKSYTINNNYIFIYLLIFLVPHNLFTALNFEYADNITSILFPSLFLILVSNLKQKYLISTILLFFLYLTKTSMFFVCIVLPFVIWFIENQKNFKIKKNLIFLGPILAIIIWSLFSFNKTDRIAIGTNSLTINSLGLTIATDERFFEYYPEKSLDLLFNKIDLPKNINNEWEFFDYFKRINSEYFSENKNKINYLKTLPKKLAVILFNIKRDGTRPDKNGNFDNHIRFSYIINKCLLNLSLILSSYFLFISIKKKKIFKDDIIFITMLGLSLLPLIAGWATGKHLVPISLMCYFYIINKHFALFKNYNIKG